MAIKLLVAGPYKDTKCQGKSCAQGDKQPLELKAKSHWHWQRKPQAERECDSKSGIVT
jgi:hypothetical protein